MQSARAVQTRNGMLQAHMRRTKEGTKARISLRDVILSGKLPAGERLVELALVERLRISRTPIRAALARLAEEGLLEKTGGGYSVRRFTEQEIRDSIHLRGTLEGLAARMAAERGARPDALARARKCIVELEPILKSKHVSQSHIAGYLSINEAFHAAIVDMADSFVIRRALEHVCALPFASPNAFVMARRELGDIWKVMFMAQQHHRAILEAIEKSEGARAESVAREHAQLALDALRLVIDASAEAKRIPGFKLLLASAA